MDQMVLETQQWLNDTYGSDSRYQRVTENGQTGWPTIYGLTRALQIELGIQSTANNFGPSTQRLFSQKWPSGIRQQNDNDTTKSNVYSVIQGALWCKGLFYRSTYHSKLLWWDRKRHREIKIRHGNWWRLYRHS